MSGARWTSITVERSVTVIVVGAPDPRPERGELAVARRRPGAWVDVAGPVLALAALAVVRGLAGRRGERRPAALEPDLRRLPPDLGRTGDRRRAA